MNWLDLAILLALAWFAIAGATAGLPRELLTLAAMLLGVVMAGLLGDRLGEEFAVLTGSQRVGGVLGFLSIFLAIYGAGQIAAVVLREAALSLTFGPLHHPGGLVVGLIKGVIMVEVALIVFSRWHFETMVGAIDGSFLAPFFLEGFPFVLRLLPGEFRRAVDAFPAPV
jgi:membrane protein required for colicin V production